MSAAAPDRRPSVTDVAGVRVGHATVGTGGSGCTVVVGPFRAAVQVVGMATGTRELGVLAPEHIVRRADAILLTGGSAFGLAAADGVAAWLAERGQGHATAAGPVPIVPGAVVFDLRPDVARPDAATGRAACDAATDGPVPVGRVGAGTGATVGKLAGVARCSPGGVGSHALPAGPGGRWTVGALAVVNALGNVLDEAGRIVAGVRESADSDRFVDAGRILDEMRLERPPPTPVAGTNTTLAVVATDAPLGPIDLARLARMAATALPRRIDPVHTPFDGDIVFAVSTASEVEPVEPQDLLPLGVRAGRALEEAVTGAVAGAVSGPAT